MASDAPSSHPDKACPVPSFAEKPIWDPEKVSNDAIEQFRGVLMSKYPSHKEIFASTKIETYSTKDIAFPPAFWPFIFIMNSFDGRNSELYFDREGNLLFDTKKDFESDWAILRKLPWTAYFKVPLMDG